MTSRRMRRVILLLALVALAMAIIAFEAEVLDVFDWTFSITLVATRCLSASILFTERPTCLTLVRSSVVCSR